MPTSFATLTPLARAAVPEHSTPFSPELVLWTEAMPGGTHWSGRVRRGTTLRFTDVQGRGNVSALLFNFDERTERYNMPDTLKAQHTARLTAGHVCYSDMGAHPLLDPVGCLRLARHRRWRARQQAPGRAVRRRALPGAPQCDVPQRHGRLPDRAGQVGPRPARRGREPQPLQQARERCRRPAALRHRGTARRGQSAWTCASRWTRWSCSRPRRTRSTRPTAWTPGGHRDHRVAFRPRRRQRPLPPALPRERPRLHQHRTLGTLTMTLLESTLDPGESHARPDRRCRRAVDGARAARPGSSASPTSKATRAVDTLFYKRRRPERALQPHPHHPGPGRAVPDPSARRSCRAKAGRC